MKPCKDCGSSTRKLTKPGPRCAGCWRTFEDIRKKRERDRRAQKVYGLKPGELDLLLKKQDGKCAICRLPFGKSRPYDIDHDHSTGFVRGLLCKSDNRKVLPFSKDNPSRLRAAAEYLEDPPAIKHIGYRKPE